MSKSPQQENRPLCARALDLGFGYTKYTKGHIDGASQRLEVDAFPSYAGSASDFAGMDAHFNVMHTEVDGRMYMVGPDIKKVAGGIGYQIMDDSFFKTPQYYAIARGAISFMNVPQDNIIDVLTVGLPLTVFRDERLRREIEQRLTGEHPSRGSLGKPERLINVRKVMLIPQVQGTLVAVNQGQDKAARQALREQTNLTIDVGYGTLMWMSSHGFRPNPALSGATMGGVYTIVEAVTQSIAPGCQTVVGITDRVDQALREKRSSVLIDGVDRPLEPHLGEMRRVIQEQLATLTRAAGSRLQVDNVFLTGGGAEFYRPYIEQAYPNRIRDHIQTDRFTNVRGFQIFSEAELHE